MNPATRIVRLPDADLATIHFIHGLNDPVGGRVVARIRGHLKRRDRYPLARSLREPVGIREDVTGARRPVEEHWLHLRAWYRVRGVRELIVSGADILPAPLLAELLDFTSELDIATWLLCEEGPGHEWLTVVDGHGGTDEDAEPFLDRFGWPELPVPARYDTAHPRLPDALVLPGTAFVTFRDDLHTHLDSSLAARVDAVWRDAFHDARQFGDRDDLDREQVAAYLFARLQRCVGRAEKIVTLRAAEAGLFTRGWVVGLPRAVALGRCDVLPTTAERSPAGWALLFAYGQPFRAAACALYAAQVPLAVQAELRLGGIAEDGSTATLPDGTDVAIEPGAQVFLAAQRRVRELCGAKGSAKLFAWERDGDPIPVPVLRTAVEAPGAEVGFPLVQQSAAAASERTFGLPAHLVRLRGRISTTALPVAPDDRATPPAPQARNTPAPRLHARVLDGTQIRRRRQERGLSLHDLAAEVGVRTAAIELIEREDAGGDLRVHQLHRLAGLLDADLGALAATDDEANTSDDAALLGMLLFHARSMVTLETLAATLGWTLDRLDTVIATLAAELRPAGLHAHRVGGKVGIQPTDVPVADEQLRELTKNHRARHTFQWSDAKALYAALDPDAGYHGKPYTRALAVQRLRNAGILTADEPPQVPASVRFSLGLMS